MVARRLSNEASAFLRAAERLYADEPAFSGWGCCYVNIGFAVELACKCFVQAQGDAVEQHLVMRHDLWRAYREATDRGLRPSGMRTAWLVMQITPYFKTMNLKYMTGPAPELPPLAQAINLTRTLLHDVQEQCGLAYK